ncbi:MAG: transposase, partial [Candidatus Omnitrophota bacterium]
VKRFFKSFSWVSGKLFRQVLQKMFIWRLKLEKPAVINLTIDTMVLNNDEAEKRHGSEPTYKKVKGFQPIQIIWNGKIIDGIFRGGKKHSNYGKTVINMTRDIVGLIRKEYSATVLIIIRLDSGFLDEKNFVEFDKLGVGFICTGKMYNVVKEHVENYSNEAWQSYDNGHQEWEYIEFGYRCNSWKQFYRAIYTRPSYEGEQRLLDFARPDNVILTNIGVNPKVLENCDSQMQNDLLKAEKIIESHHQRGGDELPHRGLKDFGFEELPFKRFPANSAVYYCMLISFFLFETFKEDVLKDVISIGSYATTVRRTALDFAAKIVETGREIILKVTNTVMNNLRFDHLWQLCQSPPPIITIDFQKINYKRSKN